MWDYTRPSGDKVSFYRFLRRVRYALSVLIILDVYVFREVNVSGGGWSVLVWLSLIGLFLVYHRLLLLTLIVAYFRKSKDHVKTLVKEISTGILTAKAFMVAIFGLDGIWILDLNF